MWVVATISRAVDDKAAHNLMGASFKRQLQLDGAISAVTFICSKTDDLSVTELLKSVPLDGDPRLCQLELKQSEAEIVRIKQELSSAGENFRDRQDEFEEMCKEIDCYETALCRSADDDPLLIVSPAVRRTRKRRPPKTPTKMRKRSRKDHDDVSEEEDEDEDSEDDYGEFEPLDIEANKKSIPKLEAIRRLRELKFQKELKAVDRRAITEQCRALRRRLREAKARTPALRSQLKSACIKHRNECSRPSIKSQYAEGVRA